MKASKKRIIWILVILLIAGAVYYQYAASKAMAKQGHYVTEPAKRTDIEATVLATGTIRPLKIVAVGAQATGEIAKVFVNIGDVVKKGDPLIELDPRIQSNKLANVEAQLQANMADRASLEAGLAQAERELGRQRKMIKDGATSRQALDDAATRVATAGAQLKQNKAQRRRIMIDLDSAKLELGYTKVRAPIDGVVLNVPVEVGGTVNAAMSSPTLVTLAKVDTMLVKAEVSEADVSKLKPGLDAWFTLVGSSGKRYKAKLGSIDPAPSYVSDMTTAGSSAVYYYGRLTVPNEDGSLRMNMTANVNIVLGKVEKAVAVPLLALVKPLEGPDNEVRVLAADGSVSNRPVTTGLDDGVLVEIKKGLNEGEVVVVGEADENAGLLPGEPRKDAGGDRGARRGGRS